jgi:hypothetical protein
MQFVEQLASEMPWLLSDKPEPLWGDDVFKDVEIFAQDTCNRALSGHFWSEPEAGIMPQYQNAIDDWSFVCRRLQKSRRVV